MNRLPLHLGCWLGLALMGCNDSADPADPDAPGTCEMGSAMRKQVELVKSTLDYMISELDTEEVKDTYEFKSSSSWGYHYPTQELCSGLRDEMKAVTPAGMYDRKPSTAAGMVRENYWIVWDLIRANLTATEEVCEEGPEWTTDEAGHRVLVTNPCIRKVTHTVYLEGWEEGKDLADSLDWLSRRVEGICADGEIAVKQDGLDELKENRAAIDGRILENGVALFLAVQCTPEEAFARLFGGSEAAPDRRVSSRSAAGQPSKGDPASHAPRNPAVNVAI